MKKRYSYFTLVEMLTVIAIIGILAAITTPIVIIARNRGMVSQAESDISGLMAALKQMDAEYGKVLSKDNKIADQTVTVSSGIAILSKDNVAAYDAMIAELSAPKSETFTKNSNPVKLAVNRKRQVFLEPQKGFDPTVEYTAQSQFLYRDPWGNPYKIMIKVTRDDKLEVRSSSPKKTIVGNYAVYSFGPDGIDNGGCNSDNPICGGGCSHDDIASWAL